MHIVQRRAQAATRIQNILRRHAAATARTLEQKIAVAGPYSQRVDPHHITPARQALEKEGIVRKKIQGGVSWYYLNTTPSDLVAARIAEQLPVHIATTKRDFCHRLGQALEIAIFRAQLKNPELEYVGSFTNLDAHDDSTLYKKEEPPSRIGANVIPGRKKLDFLLRHPSPDVGWAGIEAKNGRQWLYPRRAELRDLLSKCLYLDAVPVLIGRRIPFVTRKLFRPCGLLSWQTLRQRYATFDRELAKLASNKLLLGYADITVGNHADAPLQNFICNNLPALLPEARQRFTAFRYLLEGYILEDMSYEEFSARVRRKVEGTNEDHDWEDVVEYGHGEDYLE